MTASTTYLVSIELQTIGSLVDGKAAAGVNKLEGSLKSLESQTSNVRGAFANLGGSIVGAFTGATEKILGVGFDLLKMGALAGGGAAVYGVVGLNKELENTTMSIGAILNAAEKVPNIGEGLKLGGDIMSQMRKDAAALPGEFSDLIGIFRSIATTGFNSGMDVKGLETMSARAMAAGAVMGLRSDMVGRELAMALEGRVGGHNVFASRLGITGQDAEKFRGMDTGKRIEELTMRLGKYQGAIDAFGSSFEAQSSTLVDNGKKFLGEATLPLFERVKTELGNINTWFDNNQDTVSLWTLRIGSGLGAAFDEGKALFLEYGPILWDFAGTAYQKIKDIWVDIKPEIKSVGEAIKEALKDPGTLDKIIDALKLYAAIKAGGSIMGGLGSVASAGWSVGQLGAAAGSTASGAMAGGEGLEKLMMGASGAASALFVMAAAAVAVYAAYKVHQEYAAAVKEATEIQQNNTKMMVDSLQAWSGANGEIDTNTKQFSETIADARNNVGWFSEALSGAANLLVNLGTGGLLGVRGPRDVAEDDIRTEIERRNNKARQLRDAPDFGAEGLAYMNANLARAAAARASETKKKGPPAGSGNTNVYVSMTISSNQAPGQIARRAVDFIMAEARNPKASPHARNWSAVRP